MNDYLQNELRQIQNRNNLFDEFSIEAKNYLNDPTETLLELFCIYPNKMFEFNQTVDAFLWIDGWSRKYNKLFPLENFDKTSSYQSFICIRNKWIKYNLAEWSENEKHFIIPDKTVQFFSIYNTEEELINKYYCEEAFFNYTFEYNFERSKQIKDPDLYSEWSALYTNSQIYSYLISNYNING